MPPMCFCARRKVFKIIFCAYGIHNGDCSADPLREESPSASFVARKTSTGLYKYKCEISGLLYRWYFVCKDAECDKSIVYEACIQAMRSVQRAFSGIENGARHDGRFYACALSRVCTKKHHEETACYPAVKDSI